MTAGAHADRQPGAAHGDTAVPDLLPRLRDDPPQELVLRDPGSARVVHLLCHDQGPRITQWLRFLMAAHAAVPVTWFGPRSCGGLHVSLGLTYEGLMLQGNLPDHVRRALHLLAPAFCEGARRRSADRLGDSGASAARHWDQCFDEASLLGVYTLMHDQEKPLEESVKKIEQRADASGVRLFRVDGAYIGRPAGQQGQWVHFGLRDGLSRVVFRGLRSDRGEQPPRQDAVAIGEALLGEPREHGDNPWLLAGAPPPVRSLFRHGSFGVLRQIEQRVDAFEAFVQAQAAVLQRGWPALGPRPADWSAYVKAKLCGRWPDGRLFSATDWVSPAGVATGVPPPALDAPADPQGLGCPFGAHVRRMNPRSTRAGAHAGQRSAGEPSMNDVVHARRRVLIRRGRPYGPANWAGSADNLHRGLLGHFFCASLEDQFEHLVGQWADRVPLGLPDGGTAKDPLIGHHDDPLSRFELPMPGQAASWLQPDARTGAGGFEPFVRTCGTVYAFYPGRLGLNTLLHDHDLLDPEAEEYRP